MGIKPLEKKKTGGLARKMIFLIVLLCIGLLLDIVSKNMKKNKPAVLGIVQTQNSGANPINDVKQVVDGVTQQTKNSLSSVIGLGTQLVQETASQSSAIVSGLVYDATFGKLVDQVKSLPPDQQEKIKEQICK